MSDGNKEARQGTYFSKYGIDSFYIEKPTIFWLHGAKKSGKSNIGRRLSELFESNSYKAYLLDEDVLNFGLNKGLLTNEDLKENIRRSAEVAKIVNSLGYNIFCAISTPNDYSINLVKEIIPKVRIISINTSSKDSWIKINTKEASLKDNTSFILNEINKL